MARYINRKSEDYQRSVRSNIGFKSARQSHPGSGSFKPANFFNVDENLFTTSKNSPEKSNPQLPTTKQTNEFSHHRSGAEKSYRMKKSARFADSPKIQKRGMKEAGNDKGGLLKGSGNDGIDGASGGGHGGGGVQAGNSTKKLFKNSNNKTIYESADGDLDGVYASMLDNSEVFDQIQEPELFHVKEKVEAREQGSVKSLTDSDPEDRIERENEIRRLKMLKKSKSSIVKKRKKLKLIPKMRGKKDTNKPKKIAHTTNQPKNDPETLVDLSEKVGVLSLEKLTELSHRQHRRLKPSPKLHPFIKEYLKTKTFKKYPIKGNKPLRKQLPVDNPKLKLDTITLAKKMAGKDITKLSLPVELNQPMSVLMKISEMFAYKSAFDRAAKEKDALLRLGFSMIPIFLDYGFYVRQRKKPFSPFVGETHELLWDDLEIVSEQISNDPPLAAVHGQTKNYSVECKSDLNFLVRKRANNVFTTNKLIDSSFRCSEEDWYRL